MEICNVLGFVSVPSNLTILGPILIGIVSGRFHELTSQRLGFILIFFRFLEGINLFQAPLRISFSAASGGGEKVVAVSWCSDSLSCLHIPLFILVLPSHGYHVWVDRVTKHDIFRETMTIECRVRIACICTRILG